MRLRWLLGLLLAGFLWAWVSHPLQADRLYESLIYAHRVWLVWAVLAQVVYFSLFTASYQSALRVAGIISRAWDLIPLALGAVFIGVVTPDRQVGETTLFVDALGRQGQARKRVAVGVFLRWFSDTCAYLMVLTASLAVLVLNDDLGIPESRWAWWLFAIPFGLGGFLGLGMLRPDLLERRLVDLQAWLNWLAHRLYGRPLLDDDWAGRHADEFFTASQAAQAHPMRTLRTLGLSLAAYLADLLTLYFIDRLFGDPIQPGLLVAGFVIGYLFTILPLIPQGIGIVEGVMAVVYVSGAGAETAILTALGFRGLALWLPLALGFYFVQWGQSFSPREHSLAGKWTVRVAALLTGGMGLVNLFSTVTPSIATQMGANEPGWLVAMRQASHLAISMAGFTLLLLAYELWRRQRSAWEISLLVLEFSVVFHLAKGLDFEEALLAAGLAVWLEQQQIHFTARAKEPSIGQGLRILATAVFFTLAYGTVGFMLLDRHYVPEFGLPGALRQTLKLLIYSFAPRYVSDAVPQPRTAFGSFFTESVYLVAAATLSAGGLFLAYAIWRRPPATPRQRQQARGIVEQHSCSTLAHYTLLPDKHYLFSPAGSLVAYVVCQGTAIALGDAIGPAADRAAMLKIFRRTCRRRGWRPAFYLAGSDDLPLYRQAGFNSLCIAQEARLSFSSLDPPGAGMRLLRAAEGRLLRQGYRFLVQPAGASRELLGELHEVSDEWLALVHDQEKGFSRGWFDEDYLRTCPIGLVYDPDDRLIAFASLVSEPHCSELGIDLLRHRREVAPGTADFLIASLLTYAQNEEYAGFALGLHVGTIEPPADARQARLQQKIITYLQQFDRHAGLEALKSSFLPEWSPRYLVYPQAADPNEIWQAVVEANAGG